jgi:triosephosphate isomerase
MKRAKRLAVANWKMNPPTLEEAKILFRETKKTVKKLRNTEVVLCLPHLYVAELAKGIDAGLARSKALVIGAQNASAEEKGAYTGEVSMQMLANAGVRQVIVGHSERRSMGETDKEVAAKIRAALAAGLGAILCVGESERDDNAEYLSFVGEQIKKALFGIATKDLPKITIAYEPLFAISRNADAAVKPHDLYQMVIFIKKVLSHLYGKEAGMRVRILYGGSVEPANAADLAAEGGADGFLTGHASLDADAWNKIILALENPR